MFLEVVYEVGRYLQFLEVIYEVGRCLVFLEIADII